MSISSTGRRAPASVRVTHPNRDKAIVQGTRAIVILLLLVSVVLLLVVTIGGGEALQGPSIAVQVGYIVIYLLLAFFARRWNRGTLPVASALAVLLIIFALIGGPAWFDRDASGFTQPSLDANLLGLLTLLLVPVQMLLVAFAMRGFSQGWNVELELHDAAPNPA
jgi:hypothetical protein